MHAAVMHSAAGCGCRCNAAASHSGRQHIPSSGSGAVLPSRSGADLSRSSGARCTIASRRLQSARPCAAAPQRLVQLRCSRQQLLQCSGTRCGALPTDPPMPADDSEEDLSAEEAEALAESLRKMWHEGKGADVPLPDDAGEMTGLSPQEAIEAMSMGSWRLKGLMDPPFEALESHVEGMWREMLEGDLSLYPMPKLFEGVDAVAFVAGIGGHRRPAAQSLLGVLMPEWKSKGFTGPGAQDAHVGEEICAHWIRSTLSSCAEAECQKPELKYVDSLDPEHKMPSSYAEAEWPKRGDDAYPRMQLENRCYSSRVFRRLHMELVHRQDSIQVLHCVMFPRTEFDLPILSMDMVGRSGGAISLAVIDPCPVSLNRSLPPQYNATVRQLQKQYGMATNRATPEWGQAIFSDLCVILRPEGPEQVSNFLKYAIALSRVHLQLARLVQPVEGADKKRRLEEIKEAHARYCAKQLENDKTTRVLEAGFGKEFSNRYMRTVVFDEEDVEYAPT